MSKIPGKSEYTLQKSSLDIGVVVLLIGGLLLLRDLAGVSINKYIFLVCVGVAAFVLPIEKVVYILSFVMPLYVGMPGNYITLVFLVRFLLEAKNVKLSLKNIILCILAGGFALVQAIVFEKTEIPNLIFFPSMILVMMLYSLETPFNKSKLILYYSMGTAIMGLIMLTGTLQKYDLKDLLVVSMRLGDNNSSYADEGVMNITIDPNFYGMLAIAAITTGFEVLENHQKNFSKAEKILLIASIVSSFVVALIGLSRAFFLALVVWVPMHTLSRKKIKVFIAFVLVVIVGIILIHLFMPEVMETLLNRFTEDKTVEGGGRLNLIKKFGGYWLENTWTFLFGASIFDCYVHCTPLQILFGGGIVFTILFFGFVITLPQKGKRDESQTALQRWLPMLVTLLMSTSVPALMLVNAMYPLIVTGLYKLEEEK